MITLLNAQGRRIASAVAQGAPHQAEPDAMALWQAVFETAHAVAGHDGGTGTQTGLDTHAGDQAAMAEGPVGPAAPVPASRERARASLDRLGAGGPVPYAAHGGIAARAPVDGSDALPATRVAGVGAGTVVAKPVEARGGTPTQAATLRVQASGARPVPAAPARVQAAAHEVDAEPATEAGTPARTAAPAQPPVAAESVLVHLGAEGVQVVVRHTGLTPESAVSCALETARQLTGRRDALHHVVLNGRTVYDAAAQPAAPAGPVQFIC